MCAPPAFDETGEAVLTYARWVLVNKRDAAAKVPEERVPDLPAVSIPRRLAPPARPSMRAPTMRSWREAPIASAITE
jgi:hypothetical protein